MNAKDRSIWLPQVNGDSTRLGYHAARKYGEIPKLTRPRTLKLQLDTPCSVRKLFTKAETLPLEILQKAIPIGENLARRGLMANANCIRCGLPETDSHLFFQCDYAKEVWRSIPLREELDLHGTSSSSKIEFQGMGDGLGSHQQEKKDLVGSSTIKPANISFRDPNRKVASDQRLQPRPLQ
ncbi:unnamed protein product [Thlaspi arvense]|uniref:Reverse transcriptase zinc-binding domain-containing protein n=1 Tax=Thlaspi arvense TaxID=13288 RepID=A0AAU9T5N8_THLAR|nr:unnamed protein product [Thlaspi arvense]